MEQSGGRLLAGPAEKVQSRSMSALPHPSRATRLKAGIAIGRLVLFLAAINTLAAAQQPWDGPAFSGDPAAMLRAAQTVSVKSDVNIVILLRGERFYFESDGRTTHTTRTVYRVVTPEGAEGWAEVGTTYSPWYEERPVVRARVITADAAVHVLDPATLADAPVQDESEDVYSDRRAFRGPLPAIAPGAVVEEELVVRETAPLLAAGTIHAAYFSSSVPRLRSRLEISYPATLPLRHTAQLLPGLQVSQSEAEGRVVLQMEMGPQEPVEAVELYLPGDQPAYPRVAFATGQSWQQVAELYSQLVDQQLAGADLSRVVAPATKGKTTRQEIVAAVLDRLHQDVRYTGVEYGEAAIVPRSPREVLERRYGDCKDKAALLIAMLRQAGVSAHFALLSTGPGQDVVADLPGMGEFDHAIVYAPGTPSYWIDATAEDWRLGDLPSAVQGRLALVIAPGTTVLQRIPDAPSSANRFVETREYQLSETGPASVVETSETFGSVEADYRSTYGEGGEPARKRLEDYVKSAYVAESLGKFEHTAARDFSRPFRVHLEAGKAGRGQTSPVDAAVRISAWALVTRLPNLLTEFEDEAKLSETEKEKNRRKSDLELLEPYSAEIRARVVPPPGYRPLSVPENKVTQIGPARLTQEFAADQQGVVQATLRFDTVQRRFTANEVESMKAALRKLGQGEMLLVSFEQVGRAHLAAGKIREALAEFQGLAALHPKEALHRGQVADALLAAGIGDAARAEARRATEMEPASAEAYRTLAWILQHDLVGRRFEKGWDPPAAEAAYRKAIALDKDDVLARVNLAILLEHNAYGDRYAKGARLADAIQEYEAVKDKLGELAGVEDNLPVALLRAERYADLRDLLKSMPSTPNRRALAVAAVARLEGPAAALQEARKLITEEKGRAALLVNAGDMLMRVRRYKEAVELITAGAAGSSNPAAQLARVDVIRRARRYEEIPSPENDPRSVVRQFFVRFFNPPIDESIFLLLSRHSLPESGRDEELKKFRQTVRQMRPGLAREGMSMSLVADLVLSVMQLSVEGSDATGYRIRTQSPGTPSQVFYVVREDGQYRILGGGGSGSGDADEADMGLGVLHAIAQGDLEQARHWLDWVREDQRSGGGDDPLSGPLLPRFWERGRPADRTAIEYAAAALLAGSDWAEKAVPILERGSKSAQSDAERTSFDLALARTYAKLDKTEALLPVAQELLRTAPKSAIAFRLVEGALQSAQRWSDAELAAQERLQLLPGDVDALRALVEAGVRQGQLAKVEQHHARLVEIGKAEAEDYNQLAWAALLSGAAGPAAIEAAERGTMLSQNKRAFVIHTLACLYAEVGRSNEARERLLHFMTLEGLEEPDSAAWFGFGRIAEQYGMRDAAVAAYRRVEAPKKKFQASSSTWALAQRRLQGLGSAADKPGAPK